MATDYEYENDENDTPVDDEESRAYEAMMDAQRSLDDATIMRASADIINLRRQELRDAKAWVADVMGE